MNTKAKSRSAALWIVAAVLLLSLLLLVPIIASGADEEAPVKMESGASVRITNPTGLRFTASLSASEYAKVVDAENNTYRDGYELGMIIVPSDYLAAYRAQDEIEDVLDYFVNVDKNYINLGFNPDQLLLNAETGRYEFNGAITNILDANRTRTFAALAYVEQDGARTYADADSDARDVTYVATKAIESGKYDTTVMDSLATNYGLTYTTVNVTMPDAVGGKTETVNIVGTGVTFTDVNKVLDERLGYRVSAFLEDGAAATTPATGTTYTAESIAVDVRFTHLDGTTETIEAVYGTGLKSTPSATALDTTFAHLDYTGDYKDLTADLDVKYAYTSVGTGVQSFTFAADGSATAAATAKNYVGVLANTPDLTGKGWTAEIKVKTETITQWQSYGIAVRYGEGSDWLLLGGRTNQNDIMYGQYLQNGSYPAEENNYGSLYGNSLKATMALAGWQDAEYVTVKVTYAEGNYYLYLNGAIADIKAAANLGVDSYGAPAAIGFGWGIDNFTTAVPNPSLTFSDWSVSVEGDGAWTAPTETKDDLMTYIGYTGVGTTVSSPAEGSYTLKRGPITSSANKYQVRLVGGISLLSDLSGKNWTISTEVKVADLYKYETYGFTIVYEDGNYITFGAHMNGSLGVTDFYRWINNAASSKSMYSNANPIAVAGLASQDTLPLTLTYYDGTYYCYMNGVLNGVWTAEKFGAADYGSPVKAGIGAFFQDTPEGQSLRFTNCSAAKGDAVTKPVVDAYIDYQINGGYWLNNGDGTYTLKKPYNIGSEGGGILRTDLAGKNWSMEVSYKVSELTDWTTEGFSLLWADGTQFIIGARRCVNSDKQWFRISSASGGYTAGTTINLVTAFADTINTTYTDATTLDLKLTYESGTYYFYINGYLVRVFAPGALKLPTTDPVAVGFGVKADSEMQSSKVSQLTVSGCKVAIEGESGYATPVKQTIAGTETHWTSAVDGSLTYQPTSQEFLGVKLLNVDMTEAKSWIATMNIKVSTITPWNVYGFLVQFSDGTYAALGASIRGSSIDFSKLMPAGWLYTNGGNYWLGNKSSTNAEAIAAVTAALADSDTLKITLAYDAATNAYSFYYNDVLYGTYAASAFTNTATDGTTRKLSDYGTPVNVGVGGKIDAQYNSAWPKAIFTSWSFAYTTTDDEEA